MMPEIGNALLCLALGVALLLSVYPLWGVARGDARMMASASSPATLRTRIGSVSGDMRMGTLSVTINSLMGACRSFSEATGTKTAWLTAA